MGHAIQCVLTGKQGEPASHFGPPDEVGQFCSSVFMRMHRAGFVRVRQKTVFDHLPHEPRGSPHRPHPPIGSAGDEDAPVADAVKTLCSRDVFLLLQCEQAMGLSASAMLRRVSVVFWQS